MDRSKEFQVNEFLLLRLERNETVIYVKGKRFIQCKYLLLDIQVDEIDSYNEIGLIGEIFDLKKNQEFLFDQATSNYKLSPDDEFFGHCSNLQAWYEHRYNSKLLHYNLAFPLLKELSYIDPVAKQVFKEEIAIRFESGSPNVIEYLLNEGYLKYIQAELKVGDLFLNGHLFKSLKKARSVAELGQILPLIKKLIYTVPVAEQVLKEEIAVRFDNGSPDVKMYLLDYGYLEYIKAEIDIGDLFLNGRFFKSLKKASILAQLNSIFEYLHFEIYLEEKTISSFLVTCNSEILGDVFECLLLWSYYPEKEYVIFQLIEVINDSLNNEKFFKNFMNLGKLIIENEKKSYPITYNKNNKNGFEFKDNKFFYQKREIVTFGDLKFENPTIYNDYFEFKDDSEFFYKIRDLVYLKDLEKLEKLSNNYLKFLPGFNKIPNISYNQTTKENIMRTIENGDVNDIDVIVRMRFLEYFNLTELEIVFKNPLLMNKLNKSDYWQSNENIPIWHEIYRDDHYELHGNLAYPVYKKLIKSEGLWAKNVILEEIKNVFKNNDIDGMLYVIQDVYLDYAPLKIFTEDISNLISKLHFDTCHKIIKKLCHISMYGYGGFKEEKIISKLLTVKEFNRNVIKIYDIVKSDFKEYRNRIDELNEYELENLEELDYFFSYLKRILHKNHKLKIKIDLNYQSADNSEMTLKDKKKYLKLLRSEFDFKKNNNS